MNISRLFLSLSLLGLILLLTPLGSRAQDVVTTSVDQTGITCWNLSVKDNNSSHNPINWFGLKILTPGVTFAMATGPNSDWQPTTQTNDSILYESSGASITTGVTLGSFNFCLNDTNFGKPVQIQWSTIYHLGNNTNVNSTGTLYLIPTTFQSLTQLDSVAVKADANGPKFTFHVFNNNSAQQNIYGMTIELLNEDAGTMRPSGIVAPKGWVLDSVSSYTAHFHALTGNEIGNGKNLDGFVTALRTASNNFSWVWQALSSDGTLIDRDTIRNVVGNGTNGAFAANDTVTATDQSGCLYNFTVANDHVSNQNPPSPITRFTLTSLTSGVTFNSAPTVPVNWGKAISANGDTLVFQAASTKDALPSGIMWNTFAADVNNSTSGAFGLKWKAYNGATLLDTGLLNLQCTAASKSPDKAALATAGSNCCYKLTLTNSHNPPSNIYAASISIPSGQGMFSGSAASTLSWDVSSTNPQSFRFTSSATDYMTTNATQDINFCINPAQPNKPVPITWTTYDQQGNTISSDTVNAQCAIIVQTCDSIFSVPVDQSSCLYGIVVANRRGEGTPVTTVTISPLNGWTIDSASGPTGWTKSIATGGGSVQFNSATGIADGTQGGFIIGFAGHLTQNAFSAEVVSTDANQKVCTDSLSFNCTAGVAANGDASADVTMSVRPNPVTSQSEISFTLPYRDHVSLTLVDLLGRVQANLVDATLDGGDHTAHIDGSTLAPGSYYLRIATGTTRITKKIIVQR